MKEVLDDPSEAIHYRDSLEALVRLEAQADGLTYCFQQTRVELKQWVADMEAYYRKLENAS